MGHAAATAGERIPDSAFSSDRLIVPAEPSAANRATTLKQVCPLSEQSPNAGNYSPLPLRLQGKSKYLTAVDLPSSGHEPVLLGEILETLHPAPGKIFVDCTTGRAGHAAAIASKLGSNGLFIGLDADPRNLEFARERLSNAPCPVRLFHANFAELEA